MNADTLAFELLAELYRRVGSVALDQVDLVACEDDVSTMGYFYAPDGSCTLICFEHAAALRSGRAPVRAYGQRDRALMPAMTYGHAPGSGPEQGTGEQGLALATAASAPPTKP